MYQVRDDPKTFALSRSTLEEAYNLAFDLVMAKRKSVVIGELTEKGFVEVGKLGYVELHVDLAPEEPL